MTRPVSYILQTPWLNGRTVNNVDSAPNDTGGRPSCRTCWGKAHYWCPDNTRRVVPPDGNTIETGLGETTSEDVRYVVRCTAQHTGSSNARCYRRHHQSRRTLHWTGEERKHRSMFFITVIIRPDMKPAMPDQPYDFKL